MHDAPVTADGARIRWVELPGVEPTRVYVHGLGASSPAYFAGVARHPALADWRSLLVDLLGFGLSDRPSTFGYALTDHADALATALDAAGVTKAEVIGHSMGGAIAIVLAARRPDLVTSLVVAEGNLDPAQKTSTTVSSGIAAYREEDFLSYGHPEVLARVGELWRATMRLADPLALHRSAVGLARGTSPTMRELLTRLPIPRTFLVGADSGDLRGSGELAEAGVRIVTIAGAGHNMMLDNPDAFAHAVAESAGPQAVA